MQSDETNGTVDSSSAGDRTDAEIARRTAVRRLTAAPPEPCGDCPGADTGNVSRRHFIKRGATISASLMAAGTWLAACGGGSHKAAVTQRAKTVFIDIDGGRVTTPTLWNPFVPGARSDAGLLHMMEPLFILNYQTGKVEPWLGESFEPNKSQDVWTLTLRNGVKWSDGQSFDADDIVFTFTMLKNGPLQLANAAAMHQWLDQIEKVGPRTVRFHLTGPNPRFQLDYFAAKIWAGIPIVPEHIWKDKDPLKFTNYDPANHWPVFTGPWRLTSVSPTAFVYERLDSWWGKQVGFKPLPKPERLTFVANDTEEIRVAQAVGHHLDSVMDVTTGAFESLKARNHDVISWRKNKPYCWPDPCPRYLSFNHMVEPWGDKDMRWAINHAIDRNEVVRIAYEGSTSPARFFFPPYSGLNPYVDMLDKQGLYKKYPLMEYNPKKTAQILESKGYQKRGTYYEKNGKQLTLLIDTSGTFIEISRIAQVVTEQLQRVGINATSRTIVGNAFGTNMQTGSFEAVTDWSACGSVNEPYSTMQLYMSKWALPVGQVANSNFVRWKNDEYSTNVAAMANLPLNDPNIKVHFAKAAEAWFQDLPFIPVTYSKKLYAFDTHYWTGWPTTADDYIEPPTGWQSAHKIIHRLEPRQ